MQIDRIAVIAAGPLGREIAYLAARAGYAVVLEDVNVETLESALAAIRAHLDQAVATRQITRSDRDAALGRITTLRSIEDGMRAAQFIIETTLDELETKLEVFTIFDKFALPGAILASCTSSLSVSDIATITLRAERCLALRFETAGPPFRRVEIVRTAQNSTDVIETCGLLARTLGLEAAIVLETEIDQRKASNE